MSLPLKKTQYIWMNGKFIHWDDAKIHVLTHGLHYGSGIFEGIRCYPLDNGELSIFKLKEHINRLFESAHHYQMNIPYSKIDLINVCQDLIKKNKLKDCYIRPIAWRAYQENGENWGSLGVNPFTSPVEIAITAWNWPSYGASIYKCLTSQWTRISPSALPMKAKATGQYINSVLAWKDLVNMTKIHQQAGLLQKNDDGTPQYSFEAIMLDQNGYVCEGTGENIFIVKNDVMYTPPPDATILLGITRDTVLTMAKDLGFKIVERNLTLADLYVADEFFMTGTAAEVKPVIEVDSRVINEGVPGKITETLRETYSQIVRGKNKKYNTWLTIIK